MMMKVALALPCLEEEEEADGSDSSLPRSQCESLRD